MRKLVILGSTGSIGVQALDVVARSDDLQVVGLAASGNWERLLAQAAEFEVARVSLHDDGRQHRHAASGGRVRSSAARRGSSGSSSSPAPISC